MNQEISRRRTFAIISHPDAGKTTLTEKFLLFGGQIQVAGAVKNNKIRKTATSDWMEIEKQRGISVSTSVMEFDYNGYKINILDTPGHQDFAEDTYRTLTAVDSAIIVVDGAKGVETQTRKLMEVCRMRNTPVIIFINKMDREGRDPFDLLDELEEELSISVRPLSWPINIGAKFKGVYNIYENKLDLFKPDKQRVTEKVEIDVNSNELESHIGEQDARQLRDDIELIDGVLQLAVQHDAVCDHDDAVENRIVVFVVQGRQAIGDPGNGIGFPATCRMFDQITFPRAVFFHVGDHFFHDVVLMIAGEQDLFPFHDARCAVLCDFLFFLDVTDKTVEQIHQTVPLQHSFPEIGGGITLRVHGIALAARVSRAFRSLIEGHKGSAAAF